MSSTYDQEIEELLALYQRQRAGAAETRRRINGTTGTATAPRQTVKVTANAQGEVTAIEFPTGAFRRLTPKELSEALLTTIAEARRDALEQVTHLTDLRLPSGASAAALLRGTADPADLLSEEPGMPDQVRDYIDNGLDNGSSRG
ncbi:YbaB/EbfC family nucleoid-associated protein [Kitasatospora sp. NPDC048540]|uniref:YbaB/EbfC family nucleoid-associated protein n=1 Tax=Kitasatospora sp. NPDC048540 TaxID=3155634 RepID=UPI0033C51A27